MKKYAAKSPNGVDKGGLVSVVVVVRIGRNFKKTINSGIKIDPMQWDAKTRLVKTDVKGAGKYNNTIRQILSNIEDWELEMGRGQMRITPEAFAAWLKKDEQPDTFNKFFKVALNADKNLTYGSYREQKNSLNVLNDYGTVLFADLNRRFIDDYNNYLIKCGYAINTRGKHHKNIKKYINLAIDYGLLKITLDAHPYRTFKIQRQPSDRVALSENDLSKIAKLEYSGNMDRVRDLFLIACYTGMRFIDTQAITPENNVDGKLKYTPIKTIGYTGPVVIPVGELMGGRALVLLDKNKWRPMRISNQVANQHLKSIMIDAEINKYLTFHVSRHTFLTHVAFETGNIFKVMKYGGLRKTETAMIYVHLAEDI